MNSAQFSNWCKNRLRRPLIMGVLNVTPNSFSDGGKYLYAEDAYKRAMAMIAEGADIIDIGGESSRPGAETVTSDEELSRVVPVIARISAANDICISIDTCKARVMTAAVEAGAAIINDITALRGPNSLETASALKVPICLMHMQGEPKSMQNNPQYAGDVIEEINNFFQSRIKVCISAGIPEEHLLLDPGFGFGKLLQHNLYILKRLPEFCKHGLPLLLGVSRKSTIGAVLNKEVHERLFGGIALAVFAIIKGASIIRTHDVLETKQALEMIKAIEYDRTYENPNICVKNCF